MLKIFILFTSLYIISTNAYSTPCNKDIGILIDTSLSIPQRKLEVLLETFLKPFYAKFEISAQKTQFGLITFDKYSLLRFTLAENISAIEPVRHFMTRIDLALLQAKNELFTSSAGDRKDKQNVLLVITDGKPFPAKTFLLFNKSLTVLRAQNVSIFAVGYGVEANINTTVLKEIGGDNVLIMNENETLGYAPYVDPIKKMVCSDLPPGNLPWSEWSPCSVTCGSGTQSRTRTCINGICSETRACEQDPCTPSSCREIYLKHKSQVNKAYFLQIGSRKIPVYCHMSNYGIGACGGGGWTMVMKIDGQKSTFHYDSKFWTNKNEFNLPGGRTGLDHEQTKLPTYWNLPFSQICLMMKMGRQIKSFVLNKHANSLYSLIADNRYRSTSLGRNKWKTLIGSQASLQSFCNKEGFNVVSVKQLQSKARIGIISNQEKDCNTCDSRIGFGTGGLHDDSNSCGNQATHSPDNGNKHIKTMGYILVK